MLKQYIRKNANVPNALTLLRVLLIPVYIAVFINGSRYVALAVFVAASLTDLLDGYLARRNNQITSFGKLMDPLADKLMVISVMISQLAIGVAPWPAVVILLAKEGLMVIGGYFLLRHGIVVYSFMIGKVAHCLFIGSLVLMFFHDMFAAALPGWPLTPDQILLWIAVVCTLAAMVYYAVWSLKKGKELNAFGKDKVQSFKQIAKNFTDDER